MRMVPVLLYCFLLLGSQILLGQTSSAASPDTRDSGVTFKTNARIVLADVLVTDKSGKPIHGLKAQDFTLLEDGKPQRLQGFEESGPEIATSSAIAKLDLPANTYTNYVAGREPGAINILLFDALNTDADSLAKAREQMVAFLSKMPEKTRVALFSLGWRLRLVHGFTEDSREVIETAKQLSSSPHPLYGNARGVSQQISELQDAGAFKNPKMARVMIPFLWGDLEGREESRTIITMEALSQIARSMAGFPGRKNLIWISGGIPFDPVSTAPQMKQTSTMLAAAQIAIYPIDVRGVKFMGEDGATRDSEIMRTVPYEVSSGQNEELRSTHETMADLAKQTGGRAYFNRNDLDAAITDSVNSGSNYYTLAYQPANGNWNGKFRKIVVKTSRPDVKIESRPGYFAVPDPLGSPQIDRSFSQAMQPSAPTSTSLVMKAQVLPPEKPQKPAQIDMLVDAHDLEFTEASDHRRSPDVIFVASVWDAKGKPSGSTSATYKQALSAAELESLMKTGLRLHQEMQLSPGTYQLRLGVVDRHSGKIGTLDVPLTVESKMAAQ